MEKVPTSERLKEIMHEKHLRQIDILDLAKPYCEKYKIKLGKSDLSQFVNGKVEPGQWKLSILGMALNVSEAWLMGYDVPQKREKPIDINGNELSPDEIDLLKSLSKADRDIVFSVARQMKQREIESKG